MLLRFVVENHLSIRDRSEFSMVATGLKDFGAGLLDGPNPNLKVLPSAVLYGPNASGKSNLVSAMRTMKTLVTESHASGKPDSLLPYEPFGLDPEYKDRPTRFEIDFVLLGTRYNFGFEYDQQSILEEWLYAFPINRAQMLYHRTGEDYTFGRKLRGRNQIISELTRKNSLFISAAAQNDHSELSPVYQYFTDIIVNRSIAVDGITAKHRFGERSIDPRVIVFLKSVGTGISGYRVNESDVTENLRELRKDMFSALQKAVGSALLDEPQYDDKQREFELAHKSSDGTDVYFEMERESSGTRRLLVLLSAIFDALDRGGLIVIDEIDASLHTHACELLISLFANKEHNKKGSQIVATAHDTNLLGSTSMRRDQVWFCQKQDDGSSEIYPLSDIQVRSSDDFEKGYLQGRFGAVPTTGSLKRMIGAGEIVVE